MKAIETQELNALLMDERNRIPGDRDIDTDVLAMAVLERLDPENETQILIAHAARLELKQLARSLCRRAHEEEESLIESGNLFDFHLQQRYPTADQVGERDVYRTINNLKAEDFQYNIDRLDRESDRKKMHANALRAELEARIRRGMLAVSG